MLRISHLRLSLTCALNLSTPLNLVKFSTTCSSPPWRLPRTFKPTRANSSSFLTSNPVMPTTPAPKCSASFTSSSSGDGKEILVQHLLVKDDNLKLLLDLQQRISQGEDLSDLAAEYSICPSKEEGGMLGWVKKGQMVLEFEETAFSASLNKIVRCKTKFGWHLLQVLSEREESVLQNIQCKELHLKMQDPSFLEEAQLIDVREPEEVVTMACDLYRLPSGCRRRVSRESTMLLGESMNMLEQLIKEFRLTDDIFGIRDVFPITSRPVHHFCCVHCMNTNIRSELHFFFSFLVKEIRTPIFNGFLCF
ncbi:rhodanese-like/PpiC domain-containing protein 12, chloroplastic isoform X1 [Argentina anserina]|uniref:rhodanese-like/PpiC domain-containing protein 12, chloroplastic isoform X1 n=1 Tax=Argentina anserina TaxID=57926 RepID=UPI00217691C6|nr:rhodanese-like/PpiC domain-containing protein 12, chloroplastic isoform X1 [Potentilla anserina]